MNRVPWRRIVLIALVLFGLWVTWGIVHAGGDVPAGPSANPVTELGNGHAEGRRINGPAWTMDYSEIVEAPDGSTATLSHVRHGEIFRNGKPYVSVVADTIVVNTISNDFSASGHVLLIENDGLHKRRFRSEQAIYNGAVQLLTLPTAAHIESDGMAVDVEHATVNLKTGAMNLGRINGIT